MTRLTLQAWSFKHQWSAGRWGKKSPGLPSADCQAASKSCKVRARWEKEREVPSTSGTVLWLFKGRDGERNPNQRSSEPFCVAKLNRTALPPALEGGSTCLTPWRLWPQLKSVSQAVSAGWAESGFGLSVGAEQGSWAEFEQQLPAMLKVPGNWLRSCGESWAAFWGDQFGGTDDVGKEWSWKESWKGCFLSLSLPSTGIAVISEPPSCRPLGLSWAWVCLFLSVFLEKGS